MLSSPQLALKSNECSLGKSPAQIRHHTYGVGYLFKCFEGSTTFKIYQHKVDKMRVMGDGQTNNQRLEQFTLARSGGASDNAMWAMSSFVQVDPDGSIDPLPKMHKRCHFPGIMPREVPSQANLLRAQTFYRMHSSFSPPTFEKPCCCCV